MVGERVNREITKFSSFALACHKSGKSGSLRQNPHFTISSFENKLFELDLSIIQKLCYYGQTPQENDFFCTVMIYLFSRFLLFSIHKKLLKVSDHFVQKIQQESTTLALLPTAFYDFFSYCGGIFLPHRRKQCQDYLIDLKFGTHN